MDHVSIDHVLIDLNFGCDKFKTSMFTGVNISCSRGWSSGSGKVSSIQSPGVDLFSHVCWEVVSCVNDPAYLFGCSFSSEDPGAYHSVGASTT